MTYNQYFNQFVPSFLSQVEEMIEYKELEAHIMNSLAYQQEQINKAAQSSGASE